MDIATLLGGIRALPDLAAIVQALGQHYRPRELGPGALPVAAEAAVLLGGTENFEWLGVLTREPAEVAARLSEAFAERGRLVGVMALDPGARRLAIAVTADQSATLSLDLDRPDPGDRERLRRLLLLPPLSGLAFALRASAVLEGSDVGRRFFRQFRRALDLMAAGLSGSLRERDRRPLALIQLTRVLFLYFVAAKGWLDGRHDFLRQAVDDTLARRRHLHRDLFRPLFFGTLNRPPDQRGRAKAFGRIPFLNGGLFEPHLLERSWRGDVPNRCWRDAFDQMFERFHFTAVESADPSRIAPDMLGRVFEGIMAPEDRQKSGSFYTPSRLVERLVDAGLESLIASRLGLTREEARERLTAPDRAVRRVLRGIAVLDPAVGSGAFLLGALERLAVLRRGEAPPALLRRRILEQNLFGVDLNPMAVRLAELRLWLAIIAAEAVTDPEAVAPLPNLDGVVRQGDSLLDPTWTLAGHGLRSPSHGPPMHGLRKAFVQATGSDKRELGRQLRRAETAAFKECLHQAGRQLEAEMAECLRVARATDLFGERRSLDRGLRQRMNQLRRGMKEVRRLERRLRHDGEITWFCYEAHAADVLARGGFDLVVGNPPWVRAEQLRPSMRELLSRRYRWWRTGGRGFSHQPDLAVAFVERGAELLSPGGVLALLLPLKVTTAGYARAMRAGLAREFTLHVLADLTEDRSAPFDATTYPAAVVAARRAPSPDHTVRLTLDSMERHCCPQRHVVGGQAWTLAAPALLDALARARGDHPSLGERFTPRLGVKTGANALFLDPPPSVEPALVRQAVRGRDIRPFSAHPGARLFFPHDANGGPYQTLPRGAAAYVTQHEAMLSARVDYQGGPLWTLFRVTHAQGENRVIWADIARQLTAAALVDAEGSRLVALNTCYVLPVPDRLTALTLSAWLNCTWVRALARAAADIASGGFARFNARVVASLPLPTAVLSDQRLARLADRAGRGEQVAKELDAITAQHLQLSAEERSLLARFVGADSADRGGSPE
ncbi:MAG TPA: N-6 DNA methylase [Gemmatimonadales bacterium]|nr:N-6 DNA methylase [Gemmatimonadales bacterium]